MRKWSPLAARSLSAALVLSPSSSELSSPFPSNPANAMVPPLLCPLPLVPALLGISPSQLCAPLILAHCSNAAANVAVAEERFIIANRNVFAEASKVS